MTALYIIGGILLFFAFLLTLKATVTIELNDSLTVKASTLGFISFGILPGKKKKVKLRDYTPKKIAKRKAKQDKKDKAKAQKKLAKKEAKKNKPRPTPEQKAKKPTLTENLNMINVIVKMFFSRFFRHLKIKASRIRIKIATGDAATTAITYGAVCQAINPTVMILEKFTNINDIEKVDIDVSPDFIGDSTTVDIKISFSLRVWHLLDIGIRALASFLKTRVGALRRAARQAARREAVRNAMAQKAAQNKTAITKK